MSVVIQHLKKSFAQRQVLKDISLEINKEIFALLGPNGSGKTTLVNILCGLLKKDNGSVSIDGFDPFKTPAQARRKIGLVPQETALYEFLTAKENLDFHARFYGVPRSQRKNRIDEMLELAQLLDRAKDMVHTFSGGMKRRLALVRSLLHDPDILILDEPTLGVDVQNRNDIWNKIKEIKKQKTVLINTNYMDEADRLADRCAIIDNGNIITVDSPENLKLKHAGGVELEARVQATKTEITHLETKLLGISDTLKITKEPSSDIHLIKMPATKEPHQLLTDVAQVFKETGRIVIKSLQVRVPTLDDVFLELTGKKLRD
jgi:ABC-2 type transport system ATP-binding protein